MRAATQLASSVSGGRGVDSTGMEWPGLKCSFCGRIRPGGVAGPTTDIYICRDCVELTYELVHGADDAATRETTSDS
jgi:hypothetical protein